MLTIKLVRHGQSEFNAGERTAQEVGDANLALTEEGKRQARRAGSAIGSDFIRGAVVYVSPYQRTLQTLEGVLAGAGVDPASVRVFEDPRLREVEHGFRGDPGDQEEDRKTHGWFYYRFANGGESPADCFDRTSSFLESMMRQVDRKNADRVLIVTHGITIRCFVMRFLHFTVKQYESLANPLNCDVVTIAELAQIAEPQFKNGRWGVTGLRLR
jgi:broad specificity phosphatase PhoE